MTTPEQRTSFPVSHEAETFAESAKVLVEPYEQDIAQLSDAMRGWRKHCYDAWAALARVAALLDDIDLVGWAEWGYSDAEGGPVERLRAALTDKPTPAEEDAE